MYYGDYLEDDTIEIAFPSRSKTTGLMTALTSGSVTVRKSGGTSTTTEGVTLSASVGSVVGANKVVIDTAANGTADTFFEPGFDYLVYLSAGTVDGDSVVGEHIGTFSIENRVLLSVKRALQDYGLDHLISAAVAGTDVADNSIIAKLVSKSATADFDDFVNTTDSLQAIQDTFPSNFNTLNVNNNSIWADVRRILNEATSVDALRCEHITQELATISSAGPPTTTTFQFFGTSNTGVDVFNGRELAFSTDSSVAAGLKGFRTFIKDGNFDNDPLYEVTVDPPLPIAPTGDEEIIILGLRNFDYDIDTVANVGTVATNTDMRGTDNALLAANVPTNFSDLAITVTTGQVTVGTNNDKSGYSISGTKTTLDALNDITTTQVNTEVDTALSDINLDHLLSVAVTGTDVTDNSVIARMVSKSATADWDTFSNTTDSLEAISDTSGGDATAANQTTIINNIAALNDLSAAQVNTEVDQALVDINLDHLLSTSVAGADVADNSVIAKMVSKDGISADWDTFNNATDSLEAIRDRGDSDWITGGGGGDATAANQTTIINAISALNDLSAADVNAEVDTALSDIALDHLLSVAVTGTDITDNSVIAKLVSSSATADWDSFNNTTDSLQALRDQGDSAWITATGFSTFDASTDSVMINRILGGTLTETTSGNLAKNISFFYDLDTTTTNTVNDVGGGSGTDWTTAEKNQIRDALGITGTKVTATGGQLQNKMDTTHIDATGGAIDNVTLVTTCTTNTDMRGTDSAFLAANAPTNFSDLAITVTTGRVTVGTNADKTGYSISGTKNTLDDLNDISAATVGTQVDTSLTSYGGPTKAEMDAAFTEIKGSTFDGLTDTLEAIRNQTNTLATATSLATLQADVTAILEDTNVTIPQLLSIIDTVVDAIKVKTDQMTYGVANQLNVNVESMNTAEVLGAGTSADKWRGE